MDENNIQIRGKNDGENTNVFVMGHRGLTESLQKYMKFSMIGNSGNTYLNNTKINSICNVMEATTKYRFVFTEIDV